MSDYSASAVAPEVRVVRHAKNGGLPEIALLSISATGQTTLPPTGSSTGDLSTLDAGFETDA